jgi:hypothetical protein
VVIVVHMLAASPTNPRPSLWVIFTLLIMLGGSIAMFALLVRRWTSRRQWLSLAEWARLRGLKLRSHDLTQMPQPLVELQRVDARMRLLLSDKDDGLAIVQFDTEARDSAPRPSNAPGQVSIEGATIRPRWNVLLRKVRDGQTHPPAALRPANLPANASVIDLFRLTPFHGLSNDRFALLASDAKTAQRLANSSARALLPADVGLLLTNHYVMLDFSARPFDPVELDRMISVSEQICAAC